ncbi:hypothetical protein pqer_cds_1108 [Pandoravirus quercus]|uniref:Uncharacterized protein n=1 Tax=Pandoravirus quercus TaxID=2107709 RepID=A0A2U7UB08_9VIRU|nr:hypothetical protein pqer_cds_1108 [Pandoravirus quercus]AVK75530.1 hypothetical protein pqer_cds_1108 [Pandoravirus quercus]
MADALVRAINQRVPPEFAAARARGRRLIAVVPVDWTSLGGEPLVGLGPGDHVLFDDGAQVRHAIVASKWSQSRRSRYDQVATRTVESEEDGTIADGLCFIPVREWTESNPGAGLFRVIYDQSETLAPAESYTLATALMLTFSSGGLNNDLWDDFAYAFYCRTKTVLPPRPHRRGLAATTRLAREATTTWFELH